MRTALFQLLILSDSMEGGEGGKKEADRRRNGVMKALEHMCKVEVEFCSAEKGNFSKRLISCSLDRAQRALREMAPGG